jgi:hypothetical protein
MKYKIFSFSLKKTATQYEINKYNKETSSHRVVSNNHYVTFKSEEQLKRSTNEWNHLQPVHEFNIYGRQDATRIFEEFILEKYGLESYADMVTYENENKAIEAAHQIDIFLKMEKKKYSFYKTASKDRHCNFIYLLKDNNVVVYVGQSKNISRPWEHKDKKWDEVTLIEVPLNFNLNLIERLYIDKFKPKYNKGLPFSTIILEEAIKKVIENERA